MGKRAILQDTLNHGSQWLPVTVSGEFPEHLGEREGGKGSYKPFLRKGKSFSELSGHMALVRGLQPRAAYPAHWESG